jgi:(p)ppGpp synthase/HD superfamily hydrolase
MVETARMVLFSLLTGAPMGSGVRDLTDAASIDALAGALSDVSGALTLGLQVRHAHLAQASPVVAAETLSVAVPLADRLGLDDVRAGLEDRSFSLVDPDAYRTLLAQLGDAPDLTPIVDIVRSTLRDGGVGAQLSGRVKSLWSVHRKMVRKGVSAQEVFDRVGVRAVVEDEASCYAAVIALHGAFEPILKEFDDYIVHPKPSGYQSLHTAVWVPDFGPVEIQVRTASMHAAAMSGDAAHWKYKVAAPA